MLTSDIHWASLSSEGVKPDPRKIDFIVNMETPVDVQGEQRLICMVMGAPAIKNFRDYMEEKCS